MKFSISVSLILLAFFLSCTNCKDDCSSGSLEFNLPCEVFGEADTLSINDTIRFKLTIPDKLAERVSGNEYDFVDYNFKLINYMVKLDTLEGVSVTGRDFDWITLRGSSQFASDLNFIIPEYADHTYHYEVLIIPKQQGLFVFGMNSIASRLQPLEKLNGPCSRNSVAVFMKLQGDEDVNFEFLKASLDPVQVKTDRQRFDDYAGFCFYVR
jgi:hypothetical protein